MENKRKYLTEEEFARLIGVIESPRDRAIFLVCYWRGLRASEVGQLSLAAWRPAARRIHVARLKNSMSGEFPLSPEEHRALTAWVKLRGTQPGALFPSRECGGGPLARYRQTGIKRGMLHRLMRRYATAAGLPPYLQHMHVLKHSIGTHLIAKGLDVLDVKDWLGHRAVANTMIYLEVRNKQRDAAARKVYDLPEAA
jgi:type 1 fimbriae regulatory protein FimB